MVASYDERLIRIHVQERRDLILRIEFSHGVQESIEVYTIAFVQRHGEVILEEGWIEANEDERSRHGLVDVGDR